MQTGLKKTLPDRLDTRGYLFNTVAADYRTDLVRVNEARIRELAIPQGEFKHMTSGLPGTAPGQSLANGIAYLLLLNSQNFQFWDMVDGQFVRYAYEGVVGANGMRRAFDQAIQGVGAWPRVVMEMGSRESIREAVAKGIGLGVVSEAEFIPDPRIRALPVTDAEIYTYAHVVHLRERQNARLVRAFLGALKGLLPGGTPKSRR